MDAFTGNVLALQTFWISKTFSNEPKECKKQSFMHQNRFIGIYFGIYHLSLDWFGLDLLVSKTRSVLTRMLCIQKCSKWTESFEENLYLPFEARVRLKLRASYFKLSATFHSSILSVTEFEILAMIEMFWLYQSRSIFFTILSFLYFIYVRNKSQSYTKLLWRPNSVLKVM